MPLTDHSSLIRMSVEGTIYGSQVVNVFHFQHYKNLIVTTPTSQDLADFLNYMDTNGRSKYLQPLSHDYTINKYTARTLVEPAIAVELIPLTGTLIGTQPSEGEANQVAGIVTWRTAFAGRRYRGRTYLPAMPESEVNAGVLSPAILGWITTWADWWRAVAWVGEDTQSHSANLCVLSDPDGVLPSPTTPPGKRIPTFDIVNSFVARYIPGTQRRRRVGVGS